MCLHFYLRVYQTRLFPPVSRLKPSISSTIMASITLTYTLQPPSSISTPSTSSAHLDQSIPLPLPFSPSSATAAPSANVSTTKSTTQTQTQTQTQTYYTALSTAVLEAQSTLNQHLTAWKDAIGDAEKPKEDLGKVGFGKGKAARMMAASKAAEGKTVAGEGVEVDEDEEEDEEEE